MTVFNHKTTKLTLLLLFFCLEPFNSILAQSSEQIFILWDVTGSLLPQKPGQKDLDGSIIPTYSQGNGMWRPLKEAIIECIEFAEEDPGNDISIVTFHDNIRDIFTRNVSS